ncbi:MAG TPA: hypothetical protein VK177_02025 [Flavobacteriales bacterium]|nr:hypothetical protein [Flavobacteriales bacterium]
MNIHIDQNRDSLDNTKDRVIVENNAQTIFDHIKSLENDPKNQLRWLWELMQNAEDAANENPVEIVVTRSDNVLSFSHDGSPFTEDDITHLIFHGSSKKELEGKTGKFGTGFMTTHLLSKRVQIRGCIADGRGFDFILDRSGVNPTETAKTLNDSWEAFKKSITPSTETKKTTFTYLDLAPSGVKAIENVVSKSEILVPAVLSFAKRIKRVAMENFSEIKIYEKSEAIDHRTTIKLIKNNNGKEVKYQYLFRELPEGLGTISVPLDENGFITVLDSGTPRLFITFPLIGTEKAFPLPFLIHSPDFVPSPEREKLWLKANTEETQTNKKILEAAFKEYDILVKSVISAQDIQNNYHILADLGPVPDIEWLDKEWYLLNLKDLSEKLNQHALVKTAFDDSVNFITLNESKIPYTHSGINDKEEIEDIWKLSSELFPEATPIKEDIEFWFKVLRDRESFGITQPYSITSLSICAHVDKIEEHSLNNLKTKSGNSIDFILKLIPYLEKYKREALWNEYSILPDQSGYLKKSTDLRQELLNFDEEIGEELKNISHELGFPIRNNLLHEKIIISSVDHKLVPETRTSIAANLLQSIKNKNLEDHVKNWVTGSINLLAWLLKHERFNDLSGYPVMMLNEKWDKLQQDREQPFLCPVDIWRPEFKPYYELFPSDFILSADYTSILHNEAILKKTTEKKWLLKDPLFKKNEEIKGKEITLLATRLADKEMLAKYENVEWKIKSPISFSQLAYIDSPKDKGVIDRVRGSIKRTSQLLEFVFTVLLFEDTEGFARKEIDISEKDHPDLRIGIYPSLWMLRLKERDWVKSSSSNTSDRPSVESLLPYFKNESEGQKLYSSLQEREVSRFLHFWGIGVGDLLRNIRSGTNEDESMEWDRSYVSILMNKSLTPQKVTNMLSDPSFIKQYEEKKELERKVQQNQEIGQAVEKAFEEAFKLQTGYSITRQPIGLDYEIECDFPHPLLIRATETTSSKFLIEIKSARTSEVKMTITQGATACSTNEKYILCVIPVDKEEITVEMVKTNARFVTNISELLKDRVTKVNSITELHNQATITFDPENDFVRTSIEGTLVRYAIQKKVWQDKAPNALSFNEFITFFASKV